MVDLHAHSTASDGSVRPSDLAALGRRAGLSALVLTDHDTVAGEAEFLSAARDQGLETTTGIELSTRFEFAEIHLLGYGIDPAHAGLLEALWGMRGNRRARNEAILDALARLGVPVGMDEVLAFTSDPETAGRPHIARAMAARGYVADVREAFERYIGDDRPAYVARVRPESVYGIRLLHEAGGIAIWAHPRIGFSSESFRKILGKLVDAGLDGVEAYHTNHSPAKVRDVLSAVEGTGLLVTGGSDFHGDYKPDVALGRGLGDLAVPDECWARLRERLRT